MLILNKIKPSPLSSQESPEVAWWGPNTSMSRESMVGQGLDPDSHILTGDEWWAARHQAALQGRGCEAVEAP